VRYDAPEGTITMGSRRESQRNWSRARATAAALFVTLLWSTSWVLIKTGLPDIPPLSFAGLRYAMAFACLAPVLWLRREEVHAVSAGGWALLIALGLVLYALTQGGQFLALAHLDATTLSLCLSMTAVLVAITGLTTKRGAPQPLQWVGIVAAAGGAAAYLIPAGASNGSPLGFAFAAVTVVANAAASLLGRRVNYTRVASPGVVTAISMGVGAAVLLAVGFAIEGVPRLSLRSWGLVAWLAVVNTAFAFTLWNRSLQILPAVESSVLNNTMLVQVAVLAWIFLGETHSATALLGLGFVALGTVLVQIRGRALMP
jgi:drug/metabolite transporter (DMT)-like permease